MAETFKENKGELFLANVTYFVQFLLISIDLWLKWLRLFKDQYILCHYLAWSFFSHYVYTLLNTGVCVLCCVPPRALPN